MTLANAFEAYLADVRARHLSDSSTRVYKIPFRALKRFATGRRVSMITEVDEALLRQRRESWTCKTTTHQTRLRHLKAFFRFRGRIGLGGGVPCR